MKTKTKTLTWLAALASCTVANAVTVANLFDDYTGTDFSGATVGSTTFTTNNWSVRQAVGGSALTWNTAIATALGASENADGFDGTGDFGLPAISAQSIFNDAASAPGASELVYHPYTGPADDLVIAWTADQAYSTIGFDYSFRRNGGPGVVGMAIRLNDGGAYQAFDINNGAVGATAISGTFNYNNIEAGDFVEVIIYNGDGDPGGDQSYGNFVVTTIPEPSSIALLGLGGLALILRRRK